MERLTHGTQIFGDSEKQYLYDRLKYYEDLEEQGKLLKLPCAVGDTVYAILLDKSIHRYIVYAFKIDALCLMMNVVNESFGKTVFCTREEAEDALEFY